MTTTVLERAAIATVDEGDTEHSDGHVVIEDGRISHVGAGPAPVAADNRIDASGCLVTPALVNTHHHLYQWATRGLAPDSPLFDWLTTLYPVWGRFDADTTHAAARAGLARLALTGCGTVADHHYVFPTDGGDQMNALVDAVHEIGTRGHLVRGSMDRGEPDGGLPPANVVEKTDEALADTARAIERYHDHAPEARVRIAVGPCSPFSVSERLMRGAADLAREHGVRLHTHLAETLDEHEQCHAEFGCTPAEYAEKLGWFGSDVWFAHTVHVSAEAAQRMGPAGTGAAHCPTSNGRLGTGIAPVRELLDAGVPVGLGVDGAASNESGGLGEELHQALLQARQRGGSTALTVREALRAATMGGARCLGRNGEIGSLEPGKLADIAMWRMDGFEHAGIADPVAALVLGTLPPLRRLLVGGDTVVSDGELATADTGSIAADLRTATDRLAAG